MKPRKYTEVYQFKIVLWVKPKVWRRIQVPGNYTFYALHSAIQDAMGWEDRHLHEFSFDFNPVTREETRIGDPYSDELMGTDKYLSEFRERISRWFTPRRKSMSYLYDFGDGWSHTIELEKILPAVDNLEYPKCLDGRRACPPEDCGGTDGYERLYRRAKGNPKKYEFFPDSFDPAKVVFESPRARKKRLTTENEVETTPVVTMNPDLFVLPFADELVVGPFVEPNKLNGEVIPHLRHTGLSLRLATNKGEMNAPILAYDYGGGPIDYLYLPQSALSFKLSWDSTLFPEVAEAGYVRLIRTLDDIYEFASTPRDVVSVLNELGELLSDHRGYCAPLHGGCFRFIKPQLAEKGFAISRLRKTRSRGNHVGVVWVFEKERSTGRRVTQFLHVNSFTFDCREGGSIECSEWNSPRYLLSKPLFKRLQASMAGKPITILSAEGLARATDSRAPSSA